MKSVRSLKRRSDLRRSRSVDSVVSRRQSDLGPHLVRVTSDPHLSIPRASLSRSRTDLNNNSKAASVRSPGTVIMTKEQIIDMFACPDSPGF